MLDLDETLDEPTTGGAAVRRVLGDGCSHGVFVTPPDGSHPIRPCTWVWVDGQTGRILAWRSSPAESADLPRMAFEGLTAERGVPGAVHIDNAAVPQEWLRDLEALGVRVARGGAGATASCAERASRNLDNAICNHQRAAGHVLSWDVFEAIVAESIAGLNAGAGGGVRAEPNGN